MATFVFCRPHLQPLEGRLEGLIGKELKSSRGDKTAIELFLAGIRGWEAGLRRRMLVKGAVEELGQTW